MNDVHADPSVPTSPQRRSRWKLWVIGMVLTVVAVLLLVVALLPTIISTGPGTRFALSYVNPLLNGELKIDALSVGWFSDTNLGGVELFDDAGQLVASVDQLDSELTIMSVVGGRFDFGKTTGSVDLNRVKVAADGSSNLEHIFAPLMEGDSETQIPPISGDFDVQLDATVEYVDADGAARTVKIANGKIAAQVTDLSEPIAATVNLPITDGQTGGRLALDAVNIDPSTLVVSGDVILEKFDLALLDPALQLAGRGERLTGVADGKLSASQAGGVTTIAGTLGVSNLKADGLEGEVASVDVGNIELRPNVKYDPAGDMVLDVDLLRDAEVLLHADGTLPMSALENLTALPAGTLNLQANLPSEVLALAGPFLDAEYRRVVTNLSFTAEASLDDSAGGPRLPFALTANRGSKRILNAVGTVTELNLGEKFAVAFEGLQVGKVDVADLLAYTDIEALQTALREQQVSIPSGIVSLSGAGRFDGESFVPSGSVVAKLTYLTVARNNTVLVRDHLVQLDTSYPINLKDGITTDSARFIINGDRVIIDSTVRNLTQSDAGVIADFEVRKLLVGDPAQLLAAADVSIDGFDINGGALRFVGSGKVDTTGPTPTFSTSDAVTLTLDRMGVVQLADPDVKDSEPRTLLKPTDVFVVNADLSVAQNVSLHSLRGSLNNDALLIEAHGDITELDTRRTLSNTRLLLSADLDRLTPKLQDILGETAKGTGPMIVDINMTGSYPANDPAAIRKLNADGVATVQSLDAYGLQLRDGNMPIKLANGVLNVDGGAGVNGGRANTILALDLTQDVPVLSMPNRVQLLRDSQINSLVMQVIGSTAGSFGRKTTEAAGLLDVSLLEARQVPLDFDQLAAGRGRLRVAFSLRDMDIESDAIGGALGAVSAIPQLGSSLGQLGKFNRLRGLVKDGELLIDKGTANINVALNVFDPREGLDGPLYPIGLSGTVNLASLSQNLTLTLSPELTNKWFGDEIARLLPKTGLPVKITGTLDAPKYEPAVQVQGLIENQIERGLRDLFE